MFQPNRFRQEAISSCSHLVFSILLLVNFWFNSLWIFSDIRCFANIGCLPRFRQRNDERHRMFQKTPDVLLHLHIVPYFFFFGGRGFCVDGRVVCPGTRLPCASAISCASRSLRWNQPSFLGCFFKSASVSFFLENLFR